MKNEENMFSTSQKRFQLPLCQKSVSTEISNDFTLPDYASEIRRVICITPQILPPAKYIGSNSAEFNGNIDYNLLYVGSDGALYSTPLSAEYSFTCPLDVTPIFDLNEGVSVICDFCGESIITRVTAPRKITVKCRISCKVYAYAMAVIEEKLPADADSATMQRLDGSCNLTNTFCAMGDAFTVLDELIYDSDSTRVISADAIGDIESIKCKEDSVTVSGKVILRLLLCDDSLESSARTEEKVLTFEEELDIDGICENSKCKGFLHISEIKVEIEEGKIICSAQIIPEIIAYNIYTFDYTKDLFSTEFTSESKYTNYGIPTVISSFCGNFSQNERFPLASLSLDADTKILECFASPSIEKLQKDGDKTYIQGQIKYTLICENKNEYSLCDTSAPFKYEFDCKDEFSSYIANIYMIEVKVKNDGENICIDCEFKVLCDLTSDTEICVLSECSFKDKCVKDEDVLTVCFPHKNDTVWDIAKRYSVSCEKLVSDNNIEDGIINTNHIIINN